MRYSLFLVLIAVAACAQTPAFEVATVRPNTSNARRAAQFGPDTLTITNLPLLNVLVQAYLVPPDQISVQGYEEAFAKRYDIVAKSASPVRIAELRAMLQSLLAERFHLTLHHQEELVNGYALVVNRDGPKLSAPSNPNAEPEFDKRLGGDLARQLIQFRNAGMDLLTLLLREQADMSKVRPAPPPMIVDRTGLKGGFDFTLEWTWDEPQPGESSPPEKLPALIRALRGVGLTLRPEKVPIDMLIVDHVDKSPREN
jgi:uncharacterized protein (TIGR03435 family)